MKFWGSQFPHQELKLALCSESTQSPNHWTTTQFPAPLTECLASRSPSGSHPQGYACRMWPTPPSRTAPGLIFSFHTVWTFLEGSGRSSHPRWRLCLGLCPGSFLFLTLSPLFMIINVLNKHIIMSGDSLEHLTGMLPYKGYSVFLRSSS